MIFKHMDRIVFAGDSVTDMESAQPVGEGLFENVGKSYVRIVENMLAAFYPEVYLRVTNSGIGGNTSRDLLQRFDRDVVSLKPDWVSVRQPGHPGRAGIAGGVPFQRRKDDSFRKR